MNALTTFAQSAGFFETTTGFFVTQGLLGIAVVVLALVIRNLYKELQEERKFSRELQNLRFQDQKDFIDSLKDPLNEIATQNKSIRELFTDFIAGKRKG